MAIPARHRLLFIRLFYLVLLISWTGLKAQAQSLDSTRYVGELDRSLTIQEISILPAMDNVNGIYATALQTHLSTLVEGDHRFQLSPLQLAGEVLSPDELADAPEKVKKMSQGTTADALLAIGAFKGPNGLDIKLYLFLKNDGRLLVQETANNIQKFEMAALQATVTSMYNRLIRLLPYDGLILSREMTRVTLNLGLRDGVQQGQKLSVVHLITAQRHPKFHFLVKTEKDVVGSIEITKATETLSFARIITEKESGVIQKGSKVTGVTPVDYGPALAGDPTQGARSPMRDREDAQIVFGNNPAEWQPEKQPTFGKIKALLGLGQFYNKATLTSTGSLESKENFYPRVKLEAEAWLTEKWIMRTRLLQGIIKTDNPQDSSDPAELSQSLTSYDLKFGYHHAFLGDFFGPSIQFLLGYGQTRLFVDDSDPKSFTSTTFSGLVTSVSGYFPMTPDRKWNLTANVNFYLAPNLKETPVTSGDSSSAAIHEFQLGVEYRYRQNLLLVGELGAALYSASFSGTGSRGERATSLSHQDQALNFGISYLF